MKNYIIVIAFVILLFLFCIVWNRLMMNKYKKIQSQYKHIVFGTYIDSISCLKLVGSGIDENSDNEVAKAIRKIKLSDDVRIKINE